MNISTFVTLISEQFDDTDPSIFTENTEFKTLDDYSSLTALNIISAIDDEFDVILKGEDIKKANTIKDLFEILVSKQ